MSAPGPLHPLVAAFLYRFHHPLQYWCVLCWSCCRFAVPVRLVLLFLFIRSCFWCLVFFIPVQVLLSCIGKPSIHILPSSYWNVQFCVWKKKYHKEWSYEKYNPTFEKKNPQKIQSWKIVIKWSALLCMSKKLTGQQIRVWESVTTTTNLSENKFRQIRIALFMWRVCNNILHYFLNIFIVTIFHVPLIRALFARTRTTYSHAWAARMGGAHGRASITSFLYKNV